MNKKLILPLAILVLATLACTLPSLPGADPDGDPNTLFTDDFSDTGSGWDVYSDSSGSVDYAGDGYRILVTATDLLLWGNPYQDFQNDLRIAVDATKSGGPDDNALGVICRYQDVDNFYLFIISSDGYAGIAMYKNNEFSLLSGEFMDLSDAVNQGATTNHIEATCIGSTLTLLVNGTQAATATDASFSGGDVGLFAKSFSEGNVDILFDNLVVSKP
ncbi:MAG: hypothetical protein HY781_10820 [Chloroflexi bacterium]|nr:hypothetical protein [Chloroflexota bacterium]